MRWIIEVPTAAIRVIINTVFETPKVIIERTTEEFPGAGCLAVLIIGVLVVGGMCTGLDYITDKVETGVIKKIWPQYETIAERDLKARTEEKRQKERIFASLERWIVQQKLLDEISGYKNYDDWYQIWHNGYSVIEKEVWTVSGITVRRFGYGCYSVNFVFHSPDNGETWKIQWRNDISRELNFCGLKRIHVIDEQRIYILLQCPGPVLGMLYTVDGGKNWAISPEWKPELIKSRAK